MRIIVALTIAAALLAPVAAKAAVEPGWRASLNAKMKGGASAQDICSTASSMAQISQEASFITFALDVARRYCPTGSIGKKTEKTPIEEGEKQKPIWVNGVLVPVCSHGGLCVGQLQRAIQYGR